jgi:hypothetical protein
MNTRDKRAAFYLSFTLDFLETLRNEAKPKSFEANRIAACQDSISRLLDCYRTEAMQGQDVTNALHLLEVTNAEIDRMYGELK